MKYIEREFLPKLPKRNPESHKGSYGKVTVFGGSLGMAGAVYLAVRGALKAGAGLAEAAVPERIIDIISVKLTSCMAKALPSGPDGAFSPDASEFFPGIIEGSTVLAVGPGMRTGQGQEKIVKAVLETSLPAVVDADGLNCLAFLGADTLGGRKGAVIVTPHPGEMGRLCGITTAEVQKNRESVAFGFSQKHGCVTVLKGHRTVVTDGESMYVNHTGNPGMATGGSGDVLTGIIAGIMAWTGLTPFDTACIAVWIHGTAGDAAALSVGEISMTAEDILINVPGAFRTYME